MYQDIDDQFNDLHANQEYWENIKKKGKRMLEHNENETNQKEIQRGCVGCGLLCDGYGCDCSCHQDVGA